MVEKLTLNSLATALVDMPAVSMTIARFLNLTAVALLGQLHVLEWPFIVPRIRCTCVMIVLFNQPFAMPHLPGGFIILAKD
jgi:hypothetical protein